MSRRFLTAGAVVLALITAACSVVGSHAAGAVSAAASPVTFPTKILVVLEENHSLAQMRAGMPSLNALSEKYGYATGWTAITHPSEPNYLAIVGGSTFGITDDKVPAVNAAHVGAAPSVFSQARRAGKSAKTYAESLPAPCATTDAGNYAVRHNPWTYFAHDRRACRANDVSTRFFGRDARANRLPNVGFLIPNLAHDAHDGSLATADQWLAGRLAPVLASNDFTSGRLVVVVLADEDDRHSQNSILVTVLSPRLHHRVVRVPLNHYSLTRFIAQVLHVKALGRGRTAPDLRAAFGL